MSNADWLGHLSIALKELEWEAGDNIVVEVGGTVVSGIHQPPTANERWSTPFGVRRYNKDAFIVIKNLDRDPFVPSVPNPDLKPAHEPSHDPKYLVPPSERNETN